MKSKYIWHGATLGPCHRPRTCRRWTLALPN